MSPVHDCPIGERLGFPRVSGDEPGDMSSCEIIEGFSPRERG